MDSADRLSSPLTHIRINSWFWVIIPIASLVMQMLFGSRIWMVLFIILGGTWILATAWVYTLRNSIGALREIRYGWVQVGDILQQRFTLRNTGWAPALWLELIDHSNIPGNNSNRITSLGFYATDRWVTESVCTRRGLFMLGAMEIRTGDPFGIYLLTVVYSESTPLLVLPPAVPLPNIEIAAGSSIGEGPTTHRIAFEQTIYASGVRTYLPGDSQKQIHWRTSARKNSLHTRLMENSSASSWWIYLDLNSDVHYGEGWQSTEEHGVLVAASIAEMAFQKGTPVGLVFAGKDDLTWLPPAQNPTHRIKILKTLALAKCGNVSLQQLLSSYQNSFHTRTSIIIITPDLSGQWLPTALSLHARGILPTIILQDLSYNNEQQRSDAFIKMADFGLRFYILGHELFGHQAARPGKMGHWDWRVYGNSIAKALHKPDDLHWRKLVS